MWCTGVCRTKRSVAENPLVFQPSRRPRDLPSSCVTLTAFVIRLRSSSLPTVQCETPHQKKKLSVRDMRWYVFYVPKGPCIGVNRLLDPNTT
jgi:hypothetical protein